MGFDGDQVSVPLSDEVDFMEAKLPSKSSYATTVLCAVTFLCATSMRRLGSGCARIEVLLVQGGEIHDGLTWTFTSLRWRDLALEAEDPVVL